MKLLRISFTTFALAALTCSLQVMSTVAETASGASAVLPSAPLKTVHLIVKNSAARSVSSVQPAAILQPKPTVQPAPAKTSTVSPHIEQLLDDANPHPRERAILEEVLGIVPETCSNQMKNLYVLYDGSMNRRGYSGKATMLLDGTVKDANEFQAVATHELGHFISLTCLDGTPGTANSEFLDGNRPIPDDAPSLEFYRISWENATTLKAGTTAKDCASTYAFQSDPYEDLAEVFEEYVDQPNTLAAEAAESPAMALKLAWMQKYVPLDRVHGKGLYEVKNGSRPYDTTKMVWEKI